ncbi:MAG: hypothetical protein ACQEXG_17975 [Pseudomonadota bacterium]
MSENLRTRLVEIALEWQARYGVAPSITSTLSEYDAAMLVGCPAIEYSRYMQDRTAVSRGFDFSYESVRYQVKATRPSGKPGSRITWVPKATNYDWDALIWICYDKRYAIQEAWLWDVESYRSAFDTVKRLSPDYMRQGERLYPD